ncbi:MAG TPA: 16S rRNA (guanine(527)-N(7))-methyltransferase RsmG [Candidatus Acidoferrales bacterium]|nr:16S rRNA (guanine(527)-N(7))-methyltransferase RsmG [Candidatus Acidoferrales bacterium]
MLSAQRCKLTVPASRIQTLLKPYYHVVPLEICDKIQSYMDLLSMWGRRIALTTISNEDDVIRFHFGESIFALSLESFEHGRLADVGSGAGFPGLAIKLLRPDLHVTLLEPNKKKCAFLNEVARKLQFSNVDVLPVRFEASKIPPNELEFVTSRALGRLSDLLSWSGAALRYDGRILLWLGAEDAEKTTEIPGWYWVQTSIPGTVRRRILSGSPQMKS